MQTPEEFADLLLPPSADRLIRAIVVKAIIARDAEIAEEARRTPFFIEQCFMKTRTPLKTECVGQFEFLSPGQITGLSGYLIIPLENYRETIARNYEAIDDMAKRVRP